MKEDDDIFIISQDQLSLDLDDTDTITIKSVGGISGQTLSTTLTGNLNWNNTMIGSAGAVGTGGYTLNTSIGSNGTWATSPYTYDTITLGDYSITAGSDALNVKGDANFDGDIKLKGKSLSDVLDNIEKRLAILHPNPELEERWDELKALGERYKELEKEILEKEKMWDILKK